jgi:glycosyltransferase involved in cell wall biosynthesis
MGGTGAAAREADALGIPWLEAPRVESSYAAMSFAKMAPLALSLRARRVEILLPYTTPANVAAGATRRLSGARLVIWNQRDEGLFRMDPRLERMAVRGSDRFIANSAGGARHLERDLAVDPRHIAIVENGVALRQPLATRAEWRRRIGGGGDEPVVGMVANLHRHKDHATLLRAWRLVIDRQPRARLALVGRHDDTAAALTRQAVELGVAASVAFLGASDDVAGFLSACDLGAFSSRSEGSPNAVIEQMLAGLALAATDVPGIRGVVSEAQLPFLSPPGDAAAFAERLLELMGSPEARARLGAGNRAHAAERFALGGMRSRMEELLVTALRAAAAS